MNDNEFDKLKRQIENVTLEQAIRLIPSLFGTFNIEGIAKINDAFKAEVKRKFVDAISERQHHIDEARKITTHNMNEIEQLKKLAATI